MNMEQLAQALSGKLEGQNSGFKGISTDTRNPAKGKLFVALKGPNFDAHDFLDQAEQCEVAGMLLQKKSSINVPFVVVEDTRLAIGHLAAFWRKKLALPTLAITGSNGKTTVKEMAAAIMAQSNKVYATRGNLNNDIGVPLTLLELDENHNRAIIEMGANHHGEIAYLSNITRPDVALLNNAGPAHLEGFGTVEGVANAKGEIFQGLGPDGVAVFNADDQYAWIWQGLTADKNTITFGVENEADVSCQWSGDIKGSQLRMQTPAGSLQCRIALAGKHNVMNALAASAAAIASGIALADIKAGLESLQAVSGRLQTIRGLNGCTVINDTYNANPNSLQAGLDVLVQSTGKTFLVIGDMGELGGDARQLHFNAGRGAKKSGVDKLFAIGDLSQSTAEAFGEGAQHFPDIEELIQCVKPLLSPDVMVLVKGSRSMRMERVVDALKLQENSMQV